MRNVHIRNVRIRMYMYIMYLHLHVIQELKSVLEVTRSEVVFIPYRNSSKVLNANNKSALV